MKKLIFTASIRISMLWSGLLLGLSGIVRLPAQSLYTTPYEVTTVAGLAGTGENDGVGTEAQFQGPFGVAADSFGNLFVSDCGNHTIRKITPGGTVTTFAGNPGRSGSADGTGNDALFFAPRGLAVDASDNIYVADNANHTIRKITPAGVVSTVAGYPGNAGSTDGLGSAAQFLSPYGVAVDGANNVYVVDSGNHTIRKITPGGVVTTLAGSPGQSGDMNGVGRDARFYYPRGIAADSSGNVYVSDYLNHVVRKISSEGEVTVYGGIKGSGGSAEGAAGIGQLNTPLGITLDVAGDILVTDYTGKNIRKISPSGTISIFAGMYNTEGSDNGALSVARFSFPTGLCTDHFGNVYVADMINNAVRKISPAGMVSTIAGVADSAGYRDGVGSAVRFSTPNGIAIDSLGNKYVADTKNHVIRKITPAGLVTTLAGSPGVSGSENGTGSAARFYYPYGIAIDRSDNVFVDDTLNGKIRKITPDGVVATFPNDMDLLGGGHSLVFDDSGNLYIPLGSAVRKVTPTGVVSYIAGDPNERGTMDGIGSTARFRHVYQLARDSQMNLYVSDENVIRKIAPDGTVTTLFGAYSVYGSRDGAGSTVQTYWPGGMIVDQNDDLIFANYHTIRKYSHLTGVVTTLLGAADARGSVDGVGSAARCFWPEGLALDAAGNLYFCDSANNTIRKAVMSSLPDPGIRGVALNFGSNIKMSAGIRLENLNASYSDLVAVTDTAFSHPFGQPHSLIRIMQAASVSENRAAVYTGSAVSAGVSTVPAGLPVTITYNESSTLPVAVGTYKVMAVINDGDFQGYTTGNLVINKATPTVNWNPPAIIPYGTVLGSTELNANTTVNGDFVYSIPAGTLLSLGDHPASVLFTPTDTANYNPVTVQRILTVGSDSRVPIAFDMAGYYARNNDVAAAYSTDTYGAWRHFWNYGLGEGRQFDSQFIVEEYLLLNTDLTNAFGGDKQAALLHWLTYGKPLEDRIGRVPIGFNVDSYLARYPDLAAAFGSITPTALRNVTVWNHYVDWGVREGRSDGDFEAYGYLAGNSDLATVFGTDVEAAAWHWYFYGRREGRRIPSNFDVNGYRTRNPDVVVVWGNDKYGCWLHYRDTGVYEGRVYDDLFRVLEYRARYADVQAAYGNNLTGVLNHWLFYGKPEGRLGRNP